METTQVPEKGTNESSQTNQEGKPENKPVEESSPPETGIFQRLQSERDKALLETEKLKRKLENIENLEEKEKRVNEAEERVFIAEAKVKRNEIIEKEFPQLKGKERFITLGTEEEMRQSARDLADSFGIKASKGESMKTETQATDFTSTIAFLQNLPEDQLKKELKKQPKEVVEKFYSELKKRGWGL